ncbi:TPA: hypothetical protein ACTW1J_000112 [Raoultella planticola]
MGLNEAIQFDTFNLAFFLFMALSYAFILKRRIAKGIGQWFVFLLIITSYSSYNIMVAPVHDYNQVISRTFMYHQKIFGPFNLVDVLFIITTAFFSYKFVYITKYYKKITVNNFGVKIVFNREFMVFFISFFSFILWNYLNDKGFDFGSEFIYYRGLIYFLGAMLALKYDVNNKLSVKEIFSFFLVIDALNLMSGFIATQLFNNYVWFRYVFKVTIINQDSISSFVSIYSIVAIVAIFRFKEMKKTIGGFNLFVCFAILLLSQVNFYKGLILSMSIIIMIYSISLVLARKKTISLVVIIFMGLVPLTLLALSKSDKISDTALATRSIQTLDYIEYLNTQTPLQYIIGTGLGSTYPYYHQDLDRGATKEVDVESGSERRSIQVPYLNIYKASGLLGGLTYTLLTLVALVLLIKSIIKEENVLIQALLLFLITRLYNGTGLMTPFPVIIFVVRTVYLIYVSKCEQNQDEARYDRN